jgi:hypothetical protein
MIIAALLKSRMKRRNFTERRTIMGHQTISNRSKRFKVGRSGVARFVINADKRMT